LSELRYRYLFEDSPVSIWEEDFSQVKSFLDELRQKGITDFKKHFNENPKEISRCVSMIKVLDVNQEALKLTHAKSKKELFEKLEKILDPDRPDDFLQEILNIADGKTEFEWEGINKTLDGNSINVSLRWAAAEGHENTLSKVIISLFDISKSKKAEVALHASEERYRNLVDNLGEGIVILDQNNKFLFANPSANRIFGLENGTLDHTSLNEFIKKDSLEFLTKQLNILKTSETNTFELEINLRNGEHRFVQIFARQQFDAQRNFASTFSIIHDITDRKKSEEKRIARSQFEEMLTNISTRFINVDNEDIDSEINSVLKHIGQFEKIDRSYVFRVDLHKRIMSNTHEWCREGVPSILSESQKMPISESPWLIEQITCDPLIVSQIKELPESASKEKRIFEKHDIKSIAVFPMWVNLELVGYVGFDSVGKEHIWDLENVSMLQQFANIISNAIERSRLLKILEDRAIRDELTGVLNRRGFLQIANNELVRAHRYNHPVGMILLDMDHLKKVNDTYGHIAGDLALQEIAKYCLINIRENDILGRWGGDEFVILLPESDRESTVNVAKRLQQSINEHTIAISGKELSFSISAGVALAEESVLTIDELFRNADTALYLAKEAGRNRIMTHESVDQTPEPF
jgi:diguanylate cyclase (GGDEF)-like protein/PAS domain S-box-containing protein